MRAVGQVEREPHRRVLRLAGLAHRLERGPVAKGELGRAAVASDADERGVPELGHNEALPRPEVDEGADEIAQEVAALDRRDTEPVFHGAALVALGALLPALLLLE